VFTAATAGMQISIDRKFPNLTQLIAAAAAATTTTSTAAAEEDEEAKT